MKKEKTGKHLKIKARECDCVTQGSVYHLDFLAKGGPQAVIRTALPQQAVTLTVWPHSI